MERVSPQTAPLNTGIWAGIAAYTMWGLFPIYFKVTAEVSPAELLAHRIIWSVPFGFAIILLRRQIGDVIKAIRTPRVCLMLGLAALALSLNWGVYIWAIQNDQIFQGSLGYYINPLVYVLVGVLFFQEKLSHLKCLAVVLAGAGVLILTLYGGEFPSTALILAASFTAYGVIRKQVVVGAMPGLFVETLILFLPGLAYVIWLGSNGQQVFIQADIDLKTLIVLAGPFTVLPLVAFAFAARKLSLSMLGFLQFIGPTLQFICGLYYGEVFTSAHGWCFGLIWLAVTIFCWDAWRASKTSKVAI